MVNAVLPGLSALRCVACAWMVVVLALSWDQLRRPVLAAVLVAAAVLYTALAVIWLGATPARLMARGAIALEMLIAACLVVGDGFVYGAHHEFSSNQSLGFVWPLVAVLSVGAALGVRAGATSGVLLGAARVAATFANGVRSFESSRVLSLASTALAYGLAGAVAGYAAALLRRAESEISTARAREELARTLHDGVLQTLAVIERRASDPELARLAREQDRELRDYLHGAATANELGSDLATALRRCASRAEVKFGLRAEVLVADDLPRLDERRVAALSGAVSEALANAGKHGGGQRVVVFAEPEGSRGVFCSVKDDGAGFDPLTAREGFGIGQSIRGRITEAGGRAEIRSRPGAGTEVCLWL
jgi:signal transduction histidine kinase